MSMPSDDRVLVVGPRLRIPLGEFQFSFVRSSGPGGQNVNKVNSKAVLRWQASTSPALPTDIKQRLIIQFRSRLTAEGELLIVSQRYRDQPRNVDDCLEKLREMLASILVAPKKRRPTRPGRAAKQRRLDSKKADSNKKNLRRKPERDD